MKGSLTIVGLGPGAPELITPAVTDALKDSTDIVGYSKYIERVKDTSGKSFHPSDNREEIDRAELSINLALKGKKVVVVSSGDPGVFAMASAIFEVEDKKNISIDDLSIVVLPGITALLAASARLGAPIGHDFCVINLSDNLKSWDILKSRVIAAAKADFVIAFYNPRSKSRKNQLSEIYDVLRKNCKSDRIVIYANSVSTESEDIFETTLSEADASSVSMKTLVIIGSSSTKKIRNTGYIYTPRYSGVEKN